MLAYRGQLDFAVWQHQVKILTLWQDLLRRRPLNDHRINLGSLRLISQPHPQLRPEHS
jgi:hypothetical protein